MPLPPGEAEIIGVAPGNAYVSDPLELTTTAPLVFGISPFDILRASTAPAYGTAYTVPFQYAMVEKMPVGSCRYCTTLSLLLLYCCMCVRSIIHKWPCLSEPSSTL